MTDQANLPTLNRHYQYADQILSRKNVRLKPNENLARQINIQRNAGLLEPHDVALLLFGKRRASGFVEFERRVRKIMKQKPEA